MNEESCLKYFHVTFFKSKTCNSYLYSMCLYFCGDDVWNDFVEWKPSWNFTALQKDIPVYFWRIKPKCEAFERICASWIEVVIHWMKFRSKIAADVCVWSLLFWMLYEGFSLCTDVFKNRIFTYCSQKRQCIYIIKVVKSEIAGVDLITFVRWVLMSFCFVLYLLS